MSRVYRALEKAEEEKKQKMKEERSPKIFGEKIVLKEKTPPFRFHEEEKIERSELPSKEESSFLFVPPHSFAGEEFRKLKAQIFHRLPNPPHSILITSATPQEGKTLVAVNLAVAISQEINRKAILIDGDLRKPSIYLGGNQGSKGLSNYLSDGSSMSEVLMKSEVENLQIITAGPPTPKSSELIGSKRMAELMKSLREVGDNTYIVIDSSPIISTTEPTLLAKMVDGIILVVMADRTPKESIQKSITLIDRQKIIGVVFNRVDLRQSKYYSKYDYYK